MCNKPSTFRNFALFLAITLASLHSNVGAQTQLVIQRLGRQTAQAVTVRGSPAISLDVPFVAQDPQGTVVDIEVDRVTLKIGNDSYTGGVLKPVTSQELQLAVVLDTSGSLREPDFKRVATALGQTIGRIGNSLVSVYGVNDQITYAKEKQKDLKVFETEMAAITNKVGSRPCLNSGVARALAQLENAPTPKAVLIVTNARDGGCGSESTQSIVNTAATKQIPIFAIGSGGGVTQAELEQYTGPTNGLSILGEVNNPEYAFIKMLPVFRAQWIARFNEDRAIYPKEKPQKAELLVRFKNGVEAVSTFTFDYPGNPLPAPAKIEFAGVVGSTPNGVRFNLNIINKESLKALEVSIKDPLTGDTVATQPLDADKNDFAKNTVPFPNLKNGKKYLLSVAAKNKLGNEVGRIGPAEFVFDPVLPKLEILEIKQPDSIQPDLRVSLKIDDPEGISSYRVFLQNEQNNVSIKDAEASAERLADYFVLPTYSKIGLAQGKYKVVAEARYGGDVPPVRSAAFVFEYVPVGGWAVTMSGITATLRESPLIAVGLLAVVLLGGIGLFAVLRFTARGQKIGPREVAMGLQNKPMKPKMAKIPNAANSAMGDGGNSEVGASAGGVPSVVGIVTLIEPANPPFELNLRKSPFSIGRDRTAQAQVPVDKTLGVSSMHASFIYSNNNWYIRDENSTNGTFVNGKKLDKGGQALLDKGAVIGLGPRVKLKFNAY